MEDFDELFAEFEASMGTYISTDPDGAGDLRPATVKQLMALAPSRIIDTYFEMPQDLAAILSGHLGVTRNFDPEDIEDFVYDDAGQGHAVLLKRKIKQGAYLVANPAVPAVGALLELLPKTDEGAWIYACTAACLTEAQRHKAYRRYLYRPSSASVDQKAQQNSPNGTHVSARRAENTEDPNVQQGYSLVLAVSEEQMQEQVQAILGGNKAANKRLAEDAKANPGALMRIVPSISTALSVRSGADLLEKILDAIADSTPPEEIRALLDSELTADQQIDMLKARQDLASLVASFCWPDLAVGAMFQDAIDAARDEYHQLDLTDSRFFFTLRSWAEKLSSRSDYDAELLSLHLGQLTVKQILLTAAFLDWWGDKPLDHDSFDDEDIDDMPFDMIDMLGIDPAEGRDWINSRVKSGFLPRLDDEDMINAVQSILQNRRQYINSLRPQENNVVVAPVDVVKDGGSVLDF